MRNLILCVIFMVNLLFSNTVSAYGLTGHRIIVQIAEQHISKKTKRELFKIIGSQKLAYWSNWPDFIKSDKYWKHSESYHYLNIPGNLTRQQFDLVLEKSSDENAYKKVLFLVKELKERKKIPLERKKHDLYFLIHLFGDMHQPLHVGRPEDLGGNKIKVSWFTENTNIHTVWDSKLIDYEKYSYTEYSNLLDTETTQERKEIQKGTFEDWIYDSYMIANKIYSDIKMDEKLSYNYHYKYKYAIEKQLLKGGLRLAKVLDSIFE